MENLYPYIGDMPWFRGGLSGWPTTSGRGKADNVRVLGTRDTDESDVVEMSSAPVEDIDISDF